MKQADTKNIPFLSAATLQVASSSVSLRPRQALRLYARTLILPIFASYIAAALIIIAQ